MASVKGKEHEEDEEYESDPDEARLSLALRRRRIASDDEEEEEEGEGRRGGEVVRRTDSRVLDEVEESDDEGGAPEEYDEEDLDEEEELLVEEVIEEGPNVEVRSEGVRGRAAEGEDGEGGEEGEDREKKEHEPFAVPTAGAFYMHDDRFRDNAAGRHRRTLGARKLWESKDDQRWGHDKYEQLTTNDDHHNESRRNAKGFRGRGRNRGAGRGYGRERRVKVPEENNSQVPAPNSVRGRGPRRYDPIFKHRSEAPQIQNRQSKKYVEKSVHSSSSKGSAPASTVASDTLPVKKNSVASNLNYASPPFYPSGSSSKDQTYAPKKDVQSGSANRNPQSAMDGNLPATHSNTVFRVKGGDNSMGLNKLQLDDNKVWKPTNSTQGSQVRTQGRGQGYTGKNSSPSTSHPNNPNRVGGAQPNASQRGPPIQNLAQSYQQVNVQPVPEQINNGSQASSSPPMGNASLKSFESGEESQSETGKSKTASVGKGAGAVQGGAMSPFMYNGGQIMGGSGSMGVAHGDQNFPTFLPVMQFGAQHPGGIGVHAVGMAFPGYVQPQHGQGSSEMTWLPVLAGAGGALGATYFPPYMLDGAYNPQLTAPQFPAGSSSKEAGTSNATNEWNPSQKLEQAGEEFEQRQNKPRRRYSEMKFGQ